MIRWLLFLPVRVLGRTILVIERASERAERTRIARAKQDEAERLRAERIARQAERLREQRIRREQAEQRRAEAERLRAERAEERIREAKTDMEHLERMKDDLQRLSLYAEQLEQDAGTDARKAAALAKRISIDQRIRTIDRRREQLQHIIRTGGR